MVRKIKGYFSHPGCEQLGGIFSHLRTEFFASRTEFFASNHEEVPVESRVAKGLYDRLTEHRLTEGDFAALRAATGKSRLGAREGFGWGEIGFTTADGKPIARMPTFDEFIEHSNGRDLLEFFRDYV